MSEQQTGIAPQNTPETVENTDEPLGVIRDLQNKLLEANERLELFYGAMRISTPTFGGVQQWTLHAQGWPWTHAIGNTAEKAITNVLSQLASASQQALSDYPNE